MKCDHVLCNSVRAVFVGVLFTEKAHIISESSRLQRQTKIHDAQVPRTSAVSKEAHYFEQDHRAMASDVAEVPRASRQSREPDTSSHTSTSQHQGRACASFQSEFRRPPRYCVVTEKFHREIQGWPGGRTVQHACSFSAPLRLPVGGQLPFDGPRTELGAPHRTRSSAPLHLASWTCPKTFPTARLRALRFAVVTLHEE